MKQKITFTVLAFCAAALVFVFAACENPTGSKTETPQTVATPTATPAAGTYTQAQSVTLTSATSGAAIYYTLDGSTPTASSTLYSGAISISATTTLKAIAVKGGLADSEVLTVKYNITFVTSTIEEIAPYLNSQTGRGLTAADAITLKVNMDLGDLSQTTGTNWRGLLAVLAAANKFVALDISDSAITGTSFNHNNYTVASGMDKIVNIVLPDRITSIGDGAFCNCTNLALTSLPDGITSIGIYAFFRCTNLVLTSLPSGITSIGESAFNSCTNLALTSLPDEITSIGSGTFAGCANLALTSLPDGVTSIENYAFFDCTNLALTSLPSGITSIEWSAFSGCTNLALTSLPPGITSIGDDTFYRCTNLALASLPTGITSIGVSAFEGCTNLALTSLPSGIASIGHLAFSGCTSLATISIDRENPPTAGTGIFSNSVTGTFANSGITAIYVPAASVAAYKAAPGWSEYADKIFAIE